MKQIKNIIKEKHYTYQKIIDIFRSQQITNYMSKIKERFKDNQLYPKEKLLDIMMSYIKDNQIKENTTQIKKDKLEKYFNDIISFLREKGESLRVIHVTILKNLIGESERLNINIENENSFTMNDFIVIYSNILIEKVFNKDFNEKIFNELNETYLYFIFQIKDKKLINKIKNLIYKYLYEKNDLNQFIIQTSEEIVQNTTIDDSNLKEYQLLYNEFDINFDKVKDNVLNIFGKNLKKDISEILNFFDPKKINKNLFYNSNGNINIDENRIVIDNLNFYEKKIHLFSTEFLIANGLKSEIIENDFEIFNENNLSIDQFSNYLRKIIEEINASIINNNFNTDFIKNHHIKLHRNNFHRYIIAKLIYDDKTKMNNSKEINKNSFIEINILQKKNKIKDTKANDLKNSSDDSSLFSYSSISDINKDKADNFENLINEILIRHISSDKLTQLPNISFKFNLKIPIYNEKNNSIEFKSCRLNYNNDQTEKLESNLLYGSYGFKEIDVAFRNYLKKYIKTEDSKYFNNNLEYHKDVFADNFYLFENKKENKFIIYPNSILFGEIKKTFPNRTNGRENYIDVKINKANELINEDKKIKDLSPYLFQLEKLIKKFIFFYKVYNEQKNLSNIQIVFLYDNMDIDKIINDKKLLKDKTEELLNKYNYKFPKVKIIFQLVFFDLDKRNIEINKINKAQKAEILNQKKENIEKDNIIKKINEQNLLLSKKVKEVDEQNLLLSKKVKEVDEQKNSLENQIKDINEKNLLLSKKVKEVDEQKNSVENELKDIKNKFENKKQKDKLILECIKKINEGSYDGKDKTSLIQKFLEKIMGDE